MDLINWAMAKLTILIRAVSAIFRCLLISACWKPATMTIKMSKIKTI